MSLSRSILLVGEGNFSYSASLSQSHSETATSITATCLQSQEEALRHEGAADNIQVIENSGTSLLILSLLCCDVFCWGTLFFPDVFVQVERCCSGWTAESWESVPLSRAVCLTVWFSTFLTAGERVALKRTENF